MLWLKIVYEPKLDSTRLESTRLGSARLGSSFSRNRIRASWFNYSGCFIRIFAESRSSHLFTYPRSYRVISDRCNCTRDACAPAVDLSRDVSLRVTTSPSSPHWLTIPRYTPQRCWTLRNFQSNHDGHPLGEIPRVVRCSLVDRRVSYIRSFRSVKSARNLG